MSVPIILTIPFFAPIENDWKVWLLIVGVGTYLGDILFWKLLSLIDASTTNFVGAFVAMFMIVIGVFGYDEALSLPAVAGSVMVLLGVALYSCWEFRRMTIGVLFLMFCTSLFYVPFNIAQKLQEIDGQTVISTYFWIMIARELCAPLVSFSLPSIRRQFMASVPRQPLPFFILNAISIILFLIAMFCIGSAYRVGEAALVSVVSNVQPFLVIFLGWIVSIFTPRFAPHELLSGRSLIAKVVSFSIVFIGLALLSIHQ